MTIDYCAHIAADSAGLADAAAGNLDALVESCPGWTVADLVRHMIDVHTFWGQLVDGQISGPDDYVEPTVPDDASLLAEFRANAARTVEILRAADPAAALWTWAQRKDAGFVIRHQVQEAAVHRWDAEQAAGHDFAIDTDAAVDSIEEFLSCSIVAGQDDGARLGGPLVLSADDTGRSWTLSEGPDDRLTVAAGDRVEGATVLTGTASDVLLWLYRRVPTSALAVDGDSSVADRLTSYTATD